MHNTFAMKFGLDRGRRHMFHGHGHRNHHCQEMGSVVLSGVDAGSSVRVVCLFGGQEAKRKLLDMGLVPGELLKVVQNDSDGPLLLQVQGSRLMIGRGLADKIRVAAA